MEQIQKTENWFRNSVFLLNCYSKFFVLVWNNPTEGLPLGIYVAHKKSIHVFHDIESLFFYPKHMNLPTLLRRVNKAPSINFNTLTLQNGAIGVRQGACDIAVVHWSLLRTCEVHAAVAHLLGMTQDMWGFFYKGRFSIIWTLYHKVPSLVH
jgi:hypothetical protein